MITMTGLVLTGTSPASMDAALYTRLSTYAGLVSIIGNRSYISMAPQEPTKPYLVFESEEATAVETMGSDGNLRNETYQINCFGTSMVEAKNIAAQADKALRRWSGTVGTITVQDSFIDPDKYDDYEPDSRIYSVAFRVKIWYVIP